MKIRTQLIVALLLLAVLPLSGIVLFSYVSSRRAVRQAVEAEAAALTAEMERRLGAVKSDLRSRMDRLGGLSLVEVAGAPEAGDMEQVVVRRWLAELGDAASLVESFELIPEPPAVPAPAEPVPAVPAPEAVQPGPETGRVEPGIPTEVELESIILEVTRAHEEQRARATSVREEIGLGIQLGVDVAAAVAKALATLPPEPGKGTPEPAEPGQAPEAPGAAGRSRLEQWFGRLESLERADESLERADESLERADEKLERVEERLERAEERRRRAEKRVFLAEQRKLHELVFGPGLAFVLGERGAPIGRVIPHLSAAKLLRQVLQKTRRDQGEVPFALDAENRLYVADEADRAVLEDLPLRGGAQIAPLEDWVLVTSEDPETGLSFGIARPIGESLAEVKHAARRSLSFGLSAILLALVGVVGLSTRMTRNLKVLTDGAERIAGGDLHTRVPVRSRDELGQLAESFNRMAGELSRHQEQLLEEERRRRDQEIERQVLEADNERKTLELEDARQFQLSLLPKTLPEHPSYQLAVHIETATEVGGDYYDFRQSEDALIAAVGDATGHGARAGTMVTIIKSLFSAASSESSVGDFLGDAARAIQRMDLGRMNMALIVAELRGRQLTVASAGMPPPLVHRAGSARVEEITIEGMPLGTFASSYREQRVELEAGDTVLLMSDGFPELLDADGEPLGYAKVRELFGEVAGGEPQEIIDQLAAAVSRWTDGGRPNDDVTFVVLRVR